MNTQTTETTTMIKAESFQVIKGEHLSAIVIANQILAGSRITRSSYKQVVFTDCTFNSCEFQGVTFENCVFENCNFEFSHLRNCNFVNCSFVECKWLSSSSVNSNYEKCALSQEMEKACTLHHNNISTYASDYTTDIYIELALAA